MGWNQGYTIFEATVVGAYDLGKLDQALLSVLMEPYRGTDIDSGGEAGLISEDGKDVVQIVIETFCGQLPTPPDLPRNWSEWSNEDYQTSDKWHCACADMFREITRRFGWE